MSKEARLLRVALLAAVLLVSMGARHQTPNFIVETADAKLCRQIAAAAEQWRRDLAVEWLGKPMPKWSQPCVMTVHAGPNLGAGGATSFVFDHGEVFGWRMTIQGSQERILDSVLPHEITHMVFACHFRRPLPRWADEGGATNVEHPSERMKHRTMLVQFLRTGRGIAFNQMFAMTDYPRDIMPLYAQGHSLADYLIQQRGRREYVNFLADALRDNDWSAAIERHYGIADAGALQSTWLAWVRQGSPALKTRQPSPAAAPAAEMLAVAQRRPRPEPNLIYYLPSKQLPAYAPGSTLAAQSPDPPGDQPRPAPLVNTPSEILSAGGWRAPGAEPVQPAAFVTTPPPPPAPFRSQAVRPQPIQFPQPLVFPPCGGGG